MNWSSAGRFEFNKKAEKKFKKIGKKNTKSKELSFYACNKIHFDVMFGQELSSSSPPYVASLCYS